VISEEGALPPFSGVANPLIFSPASVMGANNCSASGCCWRHSRRVSSS
jgi:hypothetical protein